MLDFGAQFIAHRTGDFLLQNGFLALNKRKFKSVAVAHAIIYSSPFAFLLLFYDHRSEAAKLASWLIIVVTHYFIDAYNMGCLWSRLYNLDFKTEPPSTPFWVIVEIDQSLHYLINYLAFLL